MKLQEICDRIKRKFDNPYQYILGNDFIIKTLLQGVPSQIFDDKLFGIDPEIFEEFDRFENIWTTKDDPWFVEYEPIIYEPYDCDQLIFDDLEQFSNGYIPQASKIYC